MKPGRKHWPEECKCAQGMMEIQMCILSQPECTLCYASLTLACTFSLLNHTKSSPPSSRYPLAPRPCCGKPLGRKSVGFVNGLRCRVKRLRLRRGWTRFERACEEMCVIPDLIFAITQRLFSPHYWQHSRIVLLYKDVTSASDAPVLAVLLMSRKLDTSSPSFQG